MRASIARRITFSQDLLAELAMPKLAKAGRQPLAPPVRLTGMMSLAVPANVVAIDAAIAVEPVTDLRNMRVSGARATRFHQ